MITTTTFAIGNEFSNMWLVILATTSFNMCLAIQEIGRTGRNGIQLGVISYLTGSCYYFQIRAIITFIVVN